MSLDLLDRNVLIEKTVNMLTHEVRTPLNIMLESGVQLADTNLDKKQQAYLEEIRKAALALMMLANDVFDLEMYAAEAPIVEPSRCNLSEYTAALALLLNQRTLAKEIRIKVEIDQSLPTQLKIDQDKLAQVLINLCSECLSHDDTTEPKLRFNSAGSIENPILEVIFTAKCEASNEGVPFCEQEGRLADMIDAAEEPVVRKILLCQRLVQSMGGAIGHEFLETTSCSQLTMTVPYSVDDNAKNSDTVEYPGEILLVEDSPANQMVATAMLNKLGFQKIDLADNGEAALTLAATNTYDLVLMDIQMPGIDGYETTRQLRQRTDSWSELPILAMTANVMPGEREKCFDAGMNDFIGKPVRNEQLLRALKRHLVFATANDAGNQKPVNGDNSNLIDEKVLADLVNSVPPEIATKMLTTFLVEMGQRIETSKTCYQTLQESPDEDTWQTLTREYHTLKSLCGTFSATGMQAVALELEMSAKERKLRPRLMQELIRTSEKVKNLFETRLAATG